ncbi:MAG: AAA family ATPase [Myxococcales bacterium]|nr:AAA family ATPase [Myxococcales bacterium]
MRIERLILRNFRRFEHFTVDLHPRLTVLAGTNGAGKSSILEGLAIAAGSWLLGFDGATAPGIRPEQVRIAEYVLGGQPNLEPQYPAAVEAVGPFVDAPWGRVLHRAGGRTTYGEALSVKAAAEAAQAAVKRGEPISLPLIAYYGAGRLWVQKKDSAAKQDRLGSRTLAYEDCLDPASNQKLFEAWMRRAEAARIQRLAEHGMGTSVPADIARPPLLTAVQQAAGAMVAGAERIYFDVARDELRVVFADGRQLPFGLLSDGYRNLIAMAADIAWRAVQLNPHLGPQALERTAGVVLVDEIELHLHPAWQREVLQRLLSTFPALQFVVTTHAPVVITSVDADSVRLLTAEGEVVGTRVAEGLTANGALREVMGVPERPDATARHLARLGALIEEGRSDEARRAYSALREQLGENDPDLAVLEWELRDLEVHGAVD